MNRRFFLGLLAALACAPKLFAKREPSWLKPGAIVKVAKYPDPRMEHLIGTVMCKRPNPRTMNQHYRPSEQLWAVRCDCVELECYEDELALATEKDIDELWIDRYCAKWFDRVHGKPIVLGPGVVVKQMGA